MLPRTILPLAVVALLSSGASAALLTIAVEVNRGSSGYWDATHVWVLPGQTVTLDVYAIFGGANGNNADDGIFGTVMGALKSSAGGMLGNLSFTPAAVVSQSGFQAGTPKDLDADTDLDIGNTPDQAQNHADWIVLMSGANTLAPAGAGDRLLVGTATFTAFAGDTLWWRTDIGWVYRNKTGLSGKTNAFKVDGSLYTLQGNDAQLAATSASIMLIPEPSTLALLGLAGLAGLALFRRRRADRRSSWMDHRITARMEPRARMGPEGPQSCPPES
jgi:hypothetical protein